MGGLTLASAVLISFVTGQQSPPLHVLKIAGGPAGSEANGTFTLTEERSAFNRATDREVIVHFQWEGVPGPHKMLRSRGELLPALWGDHHVQSAGFAKSIARRPITPEDQREDFSSIDKTFVVFITWRPSPGPYRAEVSVDDRPMWRGFVRITP